MLDQTRDVLLREPARLDEVATVGEVRCDRRCECAAGAVHVFAALDSRATQLFSATRMQEDINRFVPAEVTG